MFYIDLKCLHVVLTIVHICQQDGQTNNDLTDHRAVPDTEGPLDKHIEFYIQSSYSWHGRVVEEHFYRRLLMGTVGLVVHISKYCFYI